MTAKEHNKLVGIFLLAHGVLQGVILGLFGLIYGGMGAFIFANAQRNEEQMVGAVFIGMVLFFIFMAMIFVLPQIIGGWKLFKERPNARIWGLIASFVAILGVPLGTAAGIYGMWFLFGEEGKRFYLGGGQQQNMFNPPPPNTWQQ